MIQMKTSEIIDLRLKLFLKDFKHPFFFIHFWSCWSLSSTVLRSKFLNIDALKQTLRGCRPNIIVDQTTEGKTKQTNFVVFDAFSAFVKFGDESASLTAIRRRIVSTVGSSAVKETRSEDVG